MACSICEDPRKKDFVARRHVEGYTLRQMEDMSRDSGMTMKRETIGKHLRDCIATPAVGPVVRKVAATVKPPSAAIEDVATMVQAEVVKRLREGEARVTVQHGLQAQALLDRRAERAKDRELAITLARLLHAPAPPEAVVLRRVGGDPNDVVIEGEMVEIGP